MSIPAKVYWVLLHSLNDFCELIFFAGLSDFLGQVVAKWIIHQVHVVVDGVRKDLVSDLLIGLIDLLLQEPTPPLVPCQNGGVL